MLATFSAIRTTHDVTKKYNTLHYIFILYASFCINIEFIIHLTPYIQVLLALNKIYVKFKIYILRNTKRHIMFCARTYRRFQHYLILLKNKYYF